MAPLLDPRFFVVSARAPIEIMMGGYAWFNIEFTAEGGIVPDLDQAEASRLLLVQFVDELVEAYGVDRRYVYLMGFSQGAMMSPEHGTHATGQGGWSCRNERTTS
jgi:phospholipase/carboxylesterase